MGGPEGHVHCFGCVLSAKIGPTPELRGLRADCGYYSVYTVTPLSLLPNPIARLFKVGVCHQSSKLFALPLPPWLVQLGMRKFPRLLRTRFIDYDYRVFL